MDRFPIQQGANYGYQEAWNPAPGGHHGTDIFAAAGTPVVAVTSGVAKKGLNIKGGKTCVLKDASGTVEYYYAHLRGWAPILQSGKSVKVQAGETLGYVGSSGNAAGKPPHLHFQMRRGNNVTNPYPHLLRVDPKAGFKPIEGVAGLLALWLIWELLRKA